MNLSLFKFFIRILLGMITGKTYPFLVQLNITNRCNLKCTYCYASYYSRPTDELTFNEIKKIVDELKKAGTFRINLVGGEPLLRKDIGDIVDYICKVGIKCAITTNGILISEKIDEIKNVHTVCFSIDGKPKNNDFNRGKGAFDRAIAGLEKCKEKKIPVQLSSVITKQTVDDIDFMISLANKYNCKVGFTTLISNLEENTYSDLEKQTLNDEIKLALKRVVELKKQGSPILFSAKTYQHTLNWPDYSVDVICARNNPSDKICNAGSYFCLVDYNGDLYPCPQLVNHFSPGNILKDGFEKAYKICKEHKCYSCSIPCSNEFRMFFEKKPSVIYEQFINYFK